MGHHGRDGNTERETTDLANPTSNKIYARLGYKPLTDTTAYAFHP